MSGRALLLGVLVLAASAAGQKPAKAQRPRTIVVAPGKVTEVTVSVGDEFLLELPMSTNFNGWEWGLGEPCMKAMGCPDPHEGNALVELPAPERKGKYLLRLRAGEATTSPMYVLHVGKAFDPPTVHKLKLVIKPADPSKQRDGGS